MRTFLIINGPNLNLLGMREPGIYGGETLQQVNDRISALARQLGVAVEFFQSNHEGAIIDKIHEMTTRYDGCVINAGAYTHYSYAILDAIKAVCKPFVEIHISDIHKRESFRQVSVIRPACVCQIYGQGTDGYLTALRKLEEITR